MLRIVGASSPPADLGGRVVKLGERWSVVKGGGPAGTLIVWGDVTGQGDSFTMVRTYRPAKSSPAAAFGAYVARPPQQK